MRFSIIPSDKTIAIDGEARSGLMFTLNPAIHAVQWYGEHGEIEYVPVNGVKPPNEFITNYAAFQAALDSWSAWTPPAPGPVTPAGYVTKLIIVERLAAAGKLHAAHAALMLDTLAANLTAAQLLLRERWMAATQIPTNDPEVRALLTAIGADPDVILAP
jgi:hypothetical protein